MTGSQERFQQALNQGHSAAWDQMWDKAVGFYQMALAEIPDHPKALTSLGLALLGLERNEEAIGRWQRKTWPGIKKKPQKKGARSSSSTKAG